VSRGVGVVGKLVGVNYGDGPRITLTGNPDQWPKLEPRYPHPIEDWIKS
jgi:hypothetical protein